MTAFKPVRRRAYGEQVTEHLRDSIVSGELPRGQRLVEEQLAEQFGVSRGPIRDALRRLEIESLVESRGNGTYVIGIDVRDIDELYSLREAIELLAADLALSNVGGDGWGEMAACVETLENAADARDGDGFAAADIQFHNLIYALSGHRRLADVWRQYSPILGTLLRTTVHVELDLHESAGKHRTLLELMKTGDGQAVAKELREHLEGSHQLMLAAHRRAKGE
ncbi:transcriptional regulator, GntR family [Paramicrobacterium humi]|uniref:Transcriptional regulator, GntR family n=1 Tax=Paramicrobacterium humi TaxID=640635 RepID=A0A1H4L272_9MICO|nr:GntR family transcriptional regulator [Microbacterium humi]SEB64425.1 transcriptional regulator, GntR family [Microbacterium humi]